MSLIVLHIKILSDELDVEIDIIATLCDEPSAAVTRRLPPHSKVGVLDTNTAIHWEELRTGIEMQTGMSV